MRLESEKLVATFAVPSNNDSTPDSVQGGMVAGCFDQLLGFAVMIHGKTGPTVSLTVNFVKRRRSTGRCDSRAGSRRSTARSSRRAVDWTLLCTFSRTDPISAAALGAVLSGTGAVFCTREAVLPVSLAYTVSAHRERTVRVVAPVAGGATASIGETTRQRRGRT
jgi:acyl-coenzyme A thioesterase PaaI-like protein